MLSIFGNYNQKSSRRHFLTAGAMGLSGLSLVDLLKAEAAAGIQSSNKAVINIHLDGGPPQLDMFDLKPDAPVEIRGEFKPISTNIPGLQVGELLPKISQIADKCVFVRSLIGSAGAHDGFQCQSGFAAKDQSNIGGRPAFGSVLAKLQGATGDSAPAFVDIMQGRPQVRNSARPGFLGPTYTPFRPDISHLFTRELESGMKGELAKRGKAHAIQLNLVDGLTPDLLNDRTKLLASFDASRRTLDASGSMDALDRFTQQAVGIILSGKLANAIDLEKESPSTVAKYSFPINEPKRSTTSEDGNAGKKLLIARRMIEAGVRCVSVSFSDFDTHEGNFPRMKQLLPIVDNAIHALITDLEDRGMLNDVAIVVWGEFGRTPRIDPKSGGRHHWPEVTPALLAGGGFKGGQIIGATDHHGARVVARPVTFQDIFASLYKSLNINPLTTILDPNGRPQHLLDNGIPIRELF